MILKKYCYTAYNHFILSKIRNTSDLDLSTLHVCHFMSGSNSPLILPAGPESQIYIGRSSVDLRETLNPSKVDL